MFLIMSGAFVDQELESEFGKLPPSFLPLGNKRLFQHQVALAPKGVQIFLSVPDSYNISSIDKSWLDEKNVSLLKTPEGLTLGASLVAALNISGHSLDKPLHILYGDTLYHKLPIGDDIISISSAQSSYNWAILSDDRLQWIKDNGTQNQAISQKVIDGYFKFSKPREIIKAITQSEWSFLDGLNLYHELVGITPTQSDHWLDFGHVNTYYRSKAEFTTQRAFNELVITPKWVEKSSVKDIKIAAEANWFDKIPSKLRRYTPQYLGYSFDKGRTTYRLEYLHLTALNELYVFSKLPSNAWIQILTSCIDFISDCCSYKAPRDQNQNSLDVLFTEKTELRISEYCQNRGISLDSEWTFNGTCGLSLANVLEDSQRYLPLTDAVHTVMHGDFCFSNILYDFRSGSIKTIDPRGMTPTGEHTIYGDIRYDLAKLSHSILGLYDWIIAGYYQVDILENKIEFDIVEDNQYEDIQQIFIELVERKFGLSAMNIYAMQIQLFLSMLPLHSDDPSRQDALFANAFRLHQKLIRLEQ